MNQKPLIQPLEPSSFQDRVEALREAIGRKHQAQESLICDDERLGDAQEKAFAVEVMQQTLQLHFSKLTQEDMRRIESENLLSTSQLRELTAMSRKREISSQREEADSLQSENQLKR